MSEFDDFGADDFLADFDVDAAVAKRQSPPSNNKHGSSNISNQHADPSPDSVAGNPTPSKRTKLTSSSSPHPVNPYSTLNSANPYASSVSSFSPPARANAAAPAPAASGATSKFSTALHAAAAGGSSSGSGVSSTPFGPNSRFAVGGTVDSSDYPTFKTEPTPTASSVATSYSTTTSSAAAPPSKFNSSPVKAEGQDQKELEQSLTNTLQTYFGHSHYRPGQLEALTSLVPTSSSDSSPRDVAVFWSTGSGKSMVYQIPPLHTNKIAVVVSPLISLMEDQVSKLNGLLKGGGNNNGGGDDVAVFLGSGQSDPHAEERALNGQYRLVYVTPEKLLSGDGYFLDRLGRLHTSGGGGGGGNICLVAIDESHCVSEWGHDFRPEYRKLGESIRSHPHLSSVPLLALTATAVPRVQRDIVTNLRMRNVKIVKQSFDRENLIINVKRKPSEGSYRTALRPLVEELIQSSKSRGGAGGGGGQGQSTIIYCPTRSTVDEITSYLTSQFAAANSSIRVDAYHAGMSPPARTESHTNFLVGRSTVIVATVAFGMGIDKPDTRRVVHWGPPKTVEEYYQQIGRAGRDGLMATATMFVNDGDFSRYKSTFYLGDLSPEARVATERSIDSLRDFAMDGQGCRRAALLQFFEEVPKFGERCGTCDTCRDHAQHQGDMERDFSSDGARVVLKALDSLNGEQGLSTMEKLIKGDVVERWRYRYGVVGETVKGEMVTARGEMPKKRPLKFFRELLPSLVTSGFVKQGTKSSQISGSRYTNTFTTYNITSAGQNALRNDGTAIFLPVPSSVREIEAEEEKRRQKTLSQLQDAGFDMDQIPQAEIEQGDGDVIRALKQWHNYLDGLRRRDMLDRVNQMDDLRSRIEAWRSDMAERYRMAPGAVCEEHLVVKIAYATASLTGGTKINRETLLAVGLRSGGLDDLVAALGEWIDETKKPDAPNGDGSVSASAVPMSFPTDEPFVPPSPWAYAVYKPIKKTGLATWESSYNRFVAGEHPHAIAMSPANGKPIQVGTVVKHIFDGLAQGRPLPLKRLASVSTPPNKAEWEKLCECEDVTGFDVTKDPSTSGKEGGSFRMTDFLQPVMGDAFLLKQFNDRTEEEKAKFGHWCGMLNWYMALRRAQYVPTFEDDDASEVVDL